MNFFLKAKHWQVFLLFFGVPLLFYAGFLLLMVQKATDSDFIGGPTLFTSNFMVMYFIAIFISLATVLGWHWAITQEFQNLLPENIRIKNGFVKFTILFPAIYLIFIILTVFHLFSDPYYFEGNFFPHQFLFIFPFHMLAIFCLIFNMYKSAKIIKTAELQRTARFSDYAGEFFMIWFFMIGIWILQPKINKIYGKNNQEDLSGRLNTLDSNI